MMPPIDAWLVRCLRSIRPIELNDRALGSEAFRPLVEHLASLEAERRDDAWQGYLAGRDDRLDLMRAVAEADPNGPRPEPIEADDDPNDGWLPPRLGNLPEVEPFPLDVLPASVRDMVEAVAGSVGCPIDFPAVAALAIVGGVIGRSASLFLKGSYFASLSLWIAVIGPPSDAKSPAMDLMLGAVEPIVEELIRQHRDALKRHAGDQEASPDRKSKPPHPRRIDVDDCTAEALIQRLAENERGLLQFRDELAGLLHGMDQYRSGGKGSDRAKYLQIWSGKRSKSDRVKDGPDGPVYAPHPCLSILGPLVPDKLAALADPRGAADGFVDRFLFTYPVQLPVPDWSEHGVESEIQAPWYELIRRLWSRVLAEKDGKPHPHVLYLTGDARAAWRECHKAHVATMNDPEFPAHMRGPCGKLKEYAGRLILVLALMEDAARSDYDPARVPDVTPRIVRDAWRLASYFASHGSKVHARMRAGPARETSERRAILDWLRKAPRERFTVSELTQARKKLRNNPDLQSALDGLVRDGVIRPGPKEDRSPVFLVHPSVSGPR